MPEKKRHIAAVFDLNWPYRRHYGLFSGLQRYAREHANWTFDISSFPEIEMARGRHFDGIVGRITKECALAAAQAGVPIVNLWMDSPLAGAVPEVHPDFREAGRIAAVHLHNRGFSNLAYFGFAKQAFQLQFEGISDVATRHGLRVERFRVSNKWDEQPKGWQCFESTVNEALGTMGSNTGVICMTDELARAIATTCQRIDKAIPEEIAVVGTGNDELICTAVEPSLSSIAMGYARCGYEAGRLLDGIMKGNGPESGVSVHPPRELVIRRSSDIYSVDDPKLHAALQLMSRNCQKPLSVEDIARAVGLGRKTLERRFHNQIRRTVNGELTRMRIAKLKRLLVETDLSVAELGERCGFGNPVSMHSMFKRSTGLTPGQYRERHSLKSLD